MIWSALIRAVTVTRDRDHSKFSFLELYALLIFLQRPDSQNEQQITSIDTPRLAQRLIAGIAEGGIESWPNNVNQSITYHGRTFQQPQGIVAGPDKQQDAACAPAAADENSCSPSTITSRKAASDVMDTNLHTSNLEFYGSSSSVAFIRHLETLSNRQATGPAGEEPERSLASLLHNTDFQPDTSQSTPATQEAVPNPDRFQFRVARRFLDAYFSNIHHIQPLFEEDEFLARCEDLWFNKPAKQPLSFVALYYATLSLGSLVMTFEDPKLFGADRFTWSRKLFNEASAILTRLGTATDVEMVQCFYMMSKICQHELNPHVAYLYSGQAARTSLAIGLNRIPISPDSADPKASAAASKTWWAVYCLDIQTSFALGRPDSLGPDQYHTQCLPTAIPGESVSSPHVLQIVPCMVDLSRIMRKVALDLYTVPYEMEQKLHRANALDADLEYWLEQVPLYLRSEQQSRSNHPLKPNRSASYIKKQSVVLRLRYLNLRMIIHAVFMTHTEIRPDEARLIRDRQCRCLQTAESTIDLIYETFRTDEFFQTWWYNSTYTLFAVSILLAAIFHQLARTQQALEKLFAHIDRAIVVLQAMDECLVARNATAIIKRTLARARKVPQPALDGRQPSASHIADLSGALHPAIDLEQQRELDNLDSLLQPQGMVNDVAETMDDLDWLNAYPIDDGQQSLFWTEWAHELNTLGT